MSCSKLINGLPKAELHLHIEGTLEPQMMWDLANKHKITLPFKNVEAIAQAYQFNNLQSFLDLYYQGADVLRDEEDFYALMWAYFLRCKNDNVVHTEIMFDPQTHTARGIPYSVFMNGFRRAIAQAKAELNISCYLILSFLRHLSEIEAFATLEQARSYYSDITAIGLDSAELGNPPTKFTAVFEKARALGFKCVAHAGEEGPPAYVWQALTDLKVDRIDHGVRSLEDAKLITYLRQHKVPLTVCPLSNLKLKVVSDMNQHPILLLLKEEVIVTVNADDPSYFGGYMNANLTAVEQSLGMQNEQLIRLIKNSFRGSFLPEAEKISWLNKIDQLAAELLG